MEKLPLRKRFRVIIPKYPALNIYSRIAISTTALGPICVATVVSRMNGWNVEVIDENNYRKYGPKNRDGYPDHDTLQAIRPAEVVGFYGGLTSTVPRLYELAKVYRKKGIITIAGGQHFVDANIQEALENGIDYVVIGEGEITIRELLDILPQGKKPVNVPGIAFLDNKGNLFKTGERPKITDFDVLPLPDFSLLRYAKIKLYPVNWTRGCGMDCEFCTVKGRPRSSSPERVMEQIASLLEVHQARHFFIVDDLFGNKRADTLKLCNLLATYQKAVGVRLDITVQIRLDRAYDTELLIAMRKAGINTVCIGFESPIAEELQAMNKKIKPEDMLKMTKLYHQAGFLVHGMFIFGYPLPPGVEMTMSLKERIKRFRKFIHQGQLDTLQVLLPVPIPGTELTKRLNQENRIFPLDYIGWKYYDGNFPLFVPDEPLDAEDMQNALKRIMGRFYRFRYIFAIARNILIFPAMMLTLWNIKFGWRRWYRHWRNDLIRFGGWIIIRRWKANFRRDPFSENLTKAKEKLR